MGLRFEEIQGGSARFAEKWRFVFYSCPHGGRGTYFAGLCLAVRTVVGGNILEVLLGVRTVEGANVLGV